MFDGLLEILKFKLCQGNYVKWPSVLLRLEMLFSRPCSIQKLFGKYIKSGNFLDAFRNFSTLQFLGFSKFKKLTEMSSI
jgi:hypothetical protein